MLASLNIKNIALIDSLELDLGSGLNILSGETGAGKSIIIDSLNFVLGERADRSLIRYGADVAQVEAVFDDYLTKPVREYLDDVGIEAEDALILRRKMTAEGKNECRVNGRVVTLGTLKGLTELLVDIHGQHEHQSLLKSANHIRLLDSLGGAQLVDRRDKVKALHAEYSSYVGKLGEYGDSRERQRRLDILTYQIDEIERVNVADGEEEELLARRKRVRNMEKIISALQSAKGQLEGYGASGVAAVLKSAGSALQSISSYDDGVEGLIDRLDSAKEELQDIADTLEDMLDKLDFDGRSAEELEERLNEVRSILRKYGGTFEALSTFYESAKEEKSRLENADDLVAKLESAIKKSGQQLAEQSAKLTDMRTKVARQLEKDIGRELGDLGMGGSTFKVNIESVDEPEMISADGGDSVEFLISPNVGEPLKPLAKIISGGEMSRFMLALKNILADVDGIGTMVFDEIDTGISGKISAVVSEKLCNISRERQVIAVTHMPSLAAMADSHFLIEKSSQNGKTLTHVSLLEDDTDEVARLIGGNDYSEFAIPHAKEMKAWAARYKSSLS